MLKNNRGLTLFLLFLVIGTVNGFAAEKHNNKLYTGPGAKYVFLFIGDGMGPMQRIVAAKALATAAKPKLWMNTLPVNGDVNTTCHGGGTTDSAAAATALACGVKTRNKILGLDEKEKPVESVAAMAKKLGWKIGIVTDVPLNHATPAGFYAHRLTRYLYDEIIEDLAVSNFEYFGGGALTIKGNRPAVFKNLKDHDYIIIESPKKMPELDPEKKYIVQTYLPYVIDRKKYNGLSLADFTRLGIKHLYSGAGKDKGFFMMVEGGKIDWSGHANDGGSLVHEVQAFDDAIKIALDFYKKHPKSTTIVITADHETGTLDFSPKNAEPNWNTARLLQQKKSYGAMNSEFKKQLKKNISFADAVALLQVNFGIKKFSPEELKMLRGKWDALIAKNKAKSDKDGKPKVKILYSSYKPVLFCMQQIFNNRCGLKWKSTGHSSAPVPINAIGVGADIFAGYYENSQVAKKLESIINAQ